MADCAVLTGVSGQVTTTDATPTNVLQIPITDNGTNAVIITTVAREQGLDDSRMWYQIALIDRTDSGMPSMKGSLSNLIAPFGDLGSVLWAVNLVFDSTNAYVQVTGEAGGTINWFSSLTNQYVCEV